MRRRVKSGLRTKPQENPESHALLDTVLGNLVSSVVQSVGGKAGSISLWDASQRKPSHTSSYGLDRKVIDQVPSLVGTIMLGPGEAEREDAKMANSGQDFVVSRLETEKGPLEVMTLPLRSQGQLVGMLCLFDPKAGSQLLAGQPEVVSSLKGQLDVVVDNARLLQRLMDEKRWLETIIQHSADGILILNHDCRILGFNPAFSRLTGWRADELRGRFCRDIFAMRLADGDSNCHTFCPVAVGEARAGHAEMRELVVNTRDGRNLDVEASYSLIRNNDGDALGAVIGIRDITARKEAEELQSTFLSVISHELQTPIAIIKGYSELLSESANDFSRDEVRQKLGVIREESDRLSRMVENLLYASRIQAGGVELRREPLALGPLVSRVAQKMSRMSEKHSVEVQLPRNLPTVLADYDSIVEVVTNLIENALKYAPGGRVLIQGRSTADEVIIGVEDEGIGVSEDDRERIFEPFSRLDSRLLRKVKGAGLGLFICKSIVEAHGGRIWVDPGKEGGARFSFSLPREERAQLPALFVPPLRSLKEKTD